MPFQEISVNLQKAIAQLNETLLAAQGTLTSAPTTMNNANLLTEPNSAQVQQIGTTLQEVSRAARSVRVLQTVSTPSRRAHQGQERGG